MITFENSNPAQKTDQTFKNQTQQKSQSKETKVEKNWTFDELMQTQELSADKIYQYALISSEKQRHQLLLKAAEMGHVEAMKDVGDNFQYGFWLHEGGKFEPNFGEAVIWYKNAAERKNSKACQELANLYLFGIEVPQDIEEAKKWLNLVFEYGGKYMTFAPPANGSILTTRTLCRTQQQALDYIAKLKLQ